jgi:uncharacterized protein with FMN-binding domain
MNLTGEPFTRKSPVRLKALLLLQQSQFTEFRPLKKTLFSLAFVAASGVYVAAANHLFTPSDEETASAIAVPTAPVGTKTSIQPSRLIVAPAAAATPSDRAQMSSIPPSTEVVSAPAPVISPKPATAPVIVAKATPSALPTPPLPRPRPTPPARVVQTQVAANSPSGFRDGTYTGASENAYYGRVQVQVTIASQKITGIKVLNYPQDRRTSRYINSQALPLLQREVIAANSANVDAISGATLTSEAYIRSLSTALQQAGAASA